MHSHSGKITCAGRVVKAGLVAAGTVIVSLTTMAPAFADPPNTTPPGSSNDPLSGTSPSSAGMPGTKLVQLILGWGMWLGLAACGMVILYGAATWAGFGSASSGRAVHGKSYVMAGLIGALIIGLVPTMVTMLFTAGKS